MCCPRNWESNIDTTLCKTWQRLLAERRVYLQLPQDNLTDEQAEILYEEQSRNDDGRCMTDLQIIENPYLIYEATRLT